MKLSNDGWCIGRDTTSVSEHVMNINAYVPIFSVRGIKTKLWHLLRTRPTTIHQGRANQIVRSVCTNQGEDEASLSSRGR